jgi:hypothetical protein
MGWRLAYGWLTPGSGYVIRPYTDVSMRVSRDVDADHHADRLADHRPLPPALTEGVERQRPGRLSWEPPPYIGNTVYVISGPTCDGEDTAGCGNPPATISVGSDPFFGDANPFGIALDEATDTVYTANIFDGEGPGTVSIINGAI